MTGVCSDQPKRGAYCVFIFYDTETTGLDKYYTQILQIALICTDDDFNILSSKKMDSRLSPWTVPSPGALLTTGFTPDDLKNTKLSHFDMMREVSAWTCEHSGGPVTWAGYNSIDYDEPVLAQNLFQSLLEPNMTTAGHGPNNQANGRLDVLILVKAMMTYFPGAITLETRNEKGNPVLKLTEVARQNGIDLSAEDAHDAMNDIKATVGMAAVVRKASPPGLWDHFLRMTSREGVDGFIRETPVFSYGALAFGNKVNTSIVTGASDGFVYDLSVDPDKYLNMEVFDICFALAEEKKGPFKKIDKSKQPILIPMDYAEATIPPAYDEKLYAERADKIRNHPTFLANVAAAAAALQNKKPTPDPSKAELMINYLPTGELKQKVDAWAKEFHDADSWKDKLALVMDFRSRFREELQAHPELGAYPRFAGRIVFENAPEELDADTQRAVNKYIASRILSTEAEGAQTTVPKAMKELMAIRKDVAEAKADPTRKSRWLEGHDAAQVESSLRSLQLFYTSLVNKYKEYLDSGQALALENFYADLKRDSAPTGPTPPKPLTGPDTKAA